LGASLEAAIALGAHAAPELEIDLVRGDGKRRARPPRVGNIATHLGAREPLGCSGRDVSRRCQAGITSASPGRWFVRRRLAQARCQGNDIDYKDNAESMGSSTAILRTPPALTPYAARRTESVRSKEQVVMRLFEAFSERRLQEALSLLTEDVVFQPMTAQVTQAGAPYVGHQGMRRYIADVEAQWDELNLRPTQIKAAGQAVVAMGLVSGRGRIGSFEDAPTTWMFKFRGERVASAQIFSDPGYVLEALGTDGEALGRD
jgi:ketosteroid isomerase-like protein